MSLLFKLGVCCLAGNSVSQLFKLPQLNFSIPPVLKGERFIQSEEKPEYYSPSSHTAQGLQAVCTEGGERHSTGSTQDPGLTPCAVGAFS